MRSARTVSVYITLIQRTPTASLVLNVRYISNVRPKAFVAHNARLIDPRCIAHDLLNGSRPQVAD
jgi:hypothetical protein